jgi:ABC-type lipoprotein release transport system permease subunit
MVLFKIAWRNIWRNKLRSLVVILSIVVGIFAGVFTIAFSYGLNQQRTESMLRSMVSHIQIHHPGFVGEYAADKTMDNGQVQQELERLPQLEAYTKRVVVQGLAQTAANSAGVMVQGIDPVAEATVTDMHQKVISGSYFDTKSRNPVLIGTKLAEKLKTQVGKYVVFTFQDKLGEVVSARCKVVGIYKSISSKIDETLVFAQIHDLQNLLGMPSEFHEVAVVMQEAGQARTGAAQLQAALPSLTVRAWQEVSPELGYADETMSSSLFIIMGIIMLALMGGIVNTMLMAVLERTRELGMVRCVGMGRVKVFVMIMIETALLSLIGGPLGLAVGASFSAYYGKAGIPLTGFDQGLEAFGISNVVYPVITPTEIMQVMAMVLATALLSAIVPGIRAIRLKPAEAVRAF